MSHFRLRKECGLMQFPWKLLFLVHLWIWTPCELITTGFLAYILVQKMKAVPFVFPLEDGGGAYIISRCMVPESMWHSEIFFCKTRLHRTIMSCVIISEIRDNIFSVSFVFPVNIFISVLPIIFLLSLPSLCFSCISLSDRLVELAEE